MADSPGQLIEVSLFQGATAYATEGNFVHEASNVVLPTPDTTPPVVSYVSPLPGGSLAPTDPVVVDVTDRESIRSAYDAVASNTDRLDAIINFAGVMGVGSLTDIPEERLARILDINVMGTYRVNKKFLPLRSEERRVGKECRSRWSP